MSPKAIIDRISNEKDADLARNAIEELKRGILKDLMELETLLTEEENDLIAIGKQAGRGIRKHKGCLYFSG
jgi:hypothetical protein